MSVTPAQPGRSRSRRSTRHDSAGRRVTNETAAASRDSGQLSHACDGGPVTEEPRTGSQSHDAFPHAVTGALPAESQSNPHIALTVLSLFPGVGLLDRAFEEEGFVVLRGPDKLWGGDIRRFRPPRMFWGIIGGPPCQDFSSLRRDDPTGVGLEMLGQFARVVINARPEWWLLENVCRVPDVLIPGYERQRVDIDQAWFAPVSRLRHVQFGSRTGRLLDLPKGPRHADCEPAALACDGRPWPVVRRLQGLPDDYDLPGFTMAAKVRAVGNGVPLVLGRVLAQAVKRAYGFDCEPLPVDAAAVESLRCRCGCGRIVAGRHVYYDAACRKRAQRARRKAGISLAADIRVQ